MRDKSVVINAIRSAISGWRSCRSDRFGTHSSAGRVAELERAPATTACAAPELRGSPKLVLACHSAGIRRDAPRWLESVGFTVVVADTAKVHQLIAEERPALVVIEASLRAASGDPVLNAVRALSPKDPPALLVLCGSEREVDPALEAGALDVVQAPINWRVASLRAARIVANLQAAAVQTQHVQPAPETQTEPHARASGANHDPLTGLPDREQFELAIERALTAEHSRDTHAIVAIFDIDRFSTANRELGRAQGNVILQQVAQQLVAGLRSEQITHRTSGLSMSMAARLGGDIFGALLTGLPNREAAVKSVQMLLGRTTAGLSGIDSRFPLSLSAGAAIAPGDGSTAVTLLLQAELALEHATVVGGVVRFHDEANLRNVANLGPINRGLTVAMGRGELQLYYQAIVDGRSERICGAEALLRWNSSELGFVSPATFVPVAEESGLMVPIGTWVLATACRQLREWLEGGLPPFRMAVNVSLCQLMRSDLTQLVRDAVRDNGLDPRLIELELSERGVLRNDPDLVRQLHQIREFGAHLALDDFGTGHSAIADLKRFPIDSLKIDQSFVRDVTSSPEDAAITGATIAMARQLGLEVVAEGVDQPGQVDFLQRHRCDRYQGFLFSEPLPAAAFAELLRRDVAGASNRFPAVRP